MCSHITDGRQGSRGEGVNTDVQLASLIVQSTCAGRTWRFPNREADQSMHGHASEQT